MKRFGFAALLGGMAGVMVGCATLSPEGGVAVTLVSIRPVQTTLFETSAEVTLRLTNESSRPLALAGSTHKLYVNGTYIGRAVTNERLTVPHLGTTTQMVTAHLENLALMRKAQELGNVPAVDYRIDSRLLATDEETARALVDEARRQAAAFGATHVELRNVNRTPIGLLTRTHKVGARLALPTTADALWSGLDRKVRNQVRKAQKEGLVAEAGGAELLDAFYQVFAHNMRDLGTPVFPRELFASVLALFPAGARVFVVRAGTAPVAAAVALGWRNSVLVPWASSLREFRNQCPNMLLYWQMLEHAIGERRAVFDFGRSSRDGGTHQFKQQWGASSFPLHWEYAMVRGQEPAHNRRGGRAPVTLPSPTKGRGVQRRG